MNVGAIDCGLAGPRVSAKPDDTGRNAHHDQLFQCIHQFRQVGGEPAGFLSWPSRFINLACFRPFPCRLAKMWERPATGAEPTAGRRNGQRRWRQPPTPARWPRGAAWSWAARMTQCTGTALSTGMKSLIGINPGAMTNSGVTGLVMFGVYNAASGLHFTFGDGSVDIGGLRPDGAGRPQLCRFNRPAANTRSRSTINRSRYWL